MKDYVSLIGAMIWGAVGRDHAPVPKQTSGMYHQGDFAFYPLLAIAMPEMMKYLSAETKANLVEFPGEHVFTAQAYSPPFDMYPRNVTTWMSEDVTIGAEAVTENVVGGPATSSSAFNPAVIQWAMGDYQVGCLTHWVTESSIHAIAGPNSLKIFYTNATPADGPVSFNFLFSGLVINHGTNVTGLESLHGLNLEVNTNALADYTTAHNTGQSVSEFIFYNITYTMPECFTDTPFIPFKVI